MPLKEKIDDEEFARIKQDVRHGELITSLKRATPSNGNTEQLTQLAGQTNALLNILANKKTGPDIQPMLKDLIGLLKETNRLLERKPSYRIIRGKLGLIERIVTE